MHGIPELVLRASLIGIGATFVQDAWSVFQSRAYGVRGLDYALLERWLGHMTKGRLCHENISGATPVAGELALGWFTHYAIGIAFAGLLLVLCGRGWTLEPTITPALAVGLATIVFPFFLMQPVMGFGVAASKMPDPEAARLRSFATHLCSGLGMYLSAEAATAVSRLWR
jgi:hypothetical protein